MPLADELAKSKKQPIMELLHRLEHSARETQPLFISPEPALAIARCRGFCAHERDRAWWALHGCPFADCHYVCKRDRDFKAHLETHDAWEGLTVELQLKLIAGTEYELPSPPTGLLRSYEKWIEEYPNILNARDQDKLQKERKKRPSGAGDQ